MWKATISFMRFSPGGRRFLIGISGVHVSSLDGGLLRGVLQDVKPPHGAVQQTCRGGGAPGFILPEHILFNLFRWRKETELKKMEMPLPFE